MPIRQVRYLHWAKTHQPATYELTVSGVARLSEADLGMSADDWSVLVCGAYGPDELVDLIVNRYGLGSQFVLPVTGTSTANFVALAAACDHGQTVAIERPVYEPLIRAAELLSLKVERFDRPAASRFVPDLNQITTLLERGARAVMLSDLHNPSGCLCPVDFMRALTDLCRQYNAVLIVDEVYRDFATLNRGLKIGTAARLGPNVITTNSLTKVYGLGGLRAGWIVASDDHVHAARQVFNHLCVDLPAPSASAATFVLRNIRRFEDRTSAIARHHGEIFSRWLQTRQDLRHYGSDGALFAYLRLPDGLPADRFCETLRRHFDTQVVPGTFFGADDHIRVGFGDPSTDLGEGLRRLGQALDQLNE